MTSIDSLAVCYCNRDFCNGAEGLGGGIGLVFTTILAFTSTTNMN